ncbi:MAG: DUF1674 domain-containing protein [Pseudomonadota bacterium]
MSRNEPASPRSETSAAATSAKDAPPPADQAADQKRKAGAKEVGGRKGPDPTRYGDWENKGIAVDF